MKNIWRELRKDKERMNSHYKELFDEAISSIEKIVGKKKLDEYSYDDCVTYLKKKYGAVETKLPDCLDYVYPPIDRQYIIEGRSIDYITDDYIRDKDVSGLFILPPLREECNGAKKNGMLVILSSKDNRLTFWWRAGNTFGYYLIDYEMAVFMNRTDRFV